MKEFNTTAICIPSKHYMVDPSDKVNAIRQLIDSGKYFTINRARQYGKTTTINALCKELSNQYIVLSLDFQDIESGSFSDGGEFSQAFARIVLDAVDFDGLKMPDGIKNGLLWPVHRIYAQLQFQQKEDTGR